MPRFYFHIRDPAGVVADEEGTDCAKPADVMKEAEASARDLIKQRVDERRCPMDVVIEVRNEQGVVAARLPLREVLENPGAPRFRS